MWQSSQFKSKQNEDISTSKIGFIGEDKLAQSFNDLALYGKVGPNRIRMIAPSASSMDQLKQNYPQKGFLPNNVADIQIYGQRGKQRHGFAQFGPTNEQILPSPMALKLADLIFNFNEIYYSHQPALKKVKQLFEMDKKKEMIDQIFKYEYAKIYNREGEEEYSVKIKFISAIFVGNDRVKEVAEEKAKKAAYQRLWEFSELFGYFEQKYSGGIDLEDFKLRILIDCENVLKVKVRERGQYQFNATLSLVHFADFHGDSNDRAQSEMIAFEKFVRYMTCLLEKSPKTETEKEQLGKVVST